MEKSDKLENRETKQRRKSEIQELKNRKMKT